MRASTAQQRTRPFVFGIVAALLALVLSGCVKLNADFQIAADETVSGSLAMLVDPRAFEDLGQPVDEAELDRSVAEMQNDPSVPDGVTVEKLIDDDGYMGMLMTFDRVPAEEFSTGSATSEFGGPSMEGISVSSADGEISFEMSNPVAEAGGEAGMGMGSMRTAFDEARVSVSFPGAVIDAEGAEISGKTATWDLRDFEGDFLSATANASGFPWWVVFVIVGAVVVLGAAALIVFLVLRSRKKQQGGALGGPGVPGGFPGAPGGSYPGAPAGPGAPGGPGGHPGRQYPGIPAGHSGGPHPGGPHPGGPAGPGYPGGARPQGPMGGSGPMGPPAPGAYTGGPSAPGSGAPPAGPPPGYAQPSQPGAGGYPGAPQQGGQGHPHPGAASHPGPGGRPGPMSAPHHSAPPTHPQHPQHPQQGPGAGASSGPQAPGPRSDGRDPGDDSRFAPPGQR
ncbi:LppM family (lipo)protein [Brevibacterium album]|uniref:LppM family (lipo)protein n=1 Tax=Brevibacterium album TaxID=417948 RepID=UPI00041F1471|nr:hypothetical protein [Brevibacterium album]